MERMDSAQVVYIGESPMTARGFVDVLTEYGHEILLTCHDPDAALTIIDGCQPTLLIIGTLTPSYRAFTLCRELAEHWRDIPIIMTTRQPGDDLLAADAYYVGAMAWLDLRLDVDAQMRVIERVLAGATLFTRDQQQLANDVERLTSRHLALLRYFSESSSLETGNAAHALGITVNTVQNHLTEIRARLGVHTTAEAVERALRRSLI